MHILLIRFSSMGDVVLQTATINWLRSLYGKDVRLTFVTSKEFLPLLDRHPGLDELMGLDRRGGEGMKGLVKRIKDTDDEHPIDLILDLHATMRSFRLKLALWSIPALTVDKRRWERFLLTKIKSVALKKWIGPETFGLEAQVERIINDLDSLFGGQRGARGVRDVLKSPHGELTTLASQTSFGLKSPYIVLAPSASFLPKRWPLESFIRLAHLLLEQTSYHVVILAGPEDKFCEAFNQISSEKLHNLQGKTNLKESMAVLAESKLCIGNDSGMNHIAEAYGVPCITIFGPTDPRFGFAPHGNKSVYLSKDIFCKPCSTTGKKPCYRSRLFCMEMITVSEVFETTLKVLEAP